MTEKNTAGTLKNKKTKKKDEIKIKWRERERKFNQE